MIPHNVYSQIGFVFFLRVFTVFTNFTTFTEDKTRNSSKSLTEKIHVHPAWLGIRKLHLTGDKLKNLEVLLKAKHLMCTGKPSADDDQHSFRSFEQLHLNFRQIEYLLCDFIFEYPPARPRIQNEKIQV